MGRGAGHAVLSEDGRYPPPIGNTKHALGTYLPRNAASSGIAAIFSSVSSGHKIPPDGRGPRRPRQSMTRVRRASSVVIMTRCWSGHSHILHHAG